MEFYAINPSLENYWRSVILFGKNVASYKFALAKSLLELRTEPNDLVLLEDLAPHFAKHLCEHLSHSPKQITSKSSKFLENCLAYNSQEITHSSLIEATVKGGFNNVIDAFHIVNSGEIEKRFFVDERRESKGIRLTENLFELANSAQFENFENEIEARWRLVEEAWRLGISKNLISVQYDSVKQALFTQNNNRRVDITSCRDSLNGYQKGHCFYCNRSISTQKQSANLADVDHFLPHTLAPEISNIDGVWNLVLACTDCNRGHDGKFAKVPTVKLLEKLHKRNEYFINSHLPLRETLIRQTGKTELARQHFLQSQYNTAKLLLIHEWEPQQVQELSL